MSEGPEVKRTADRLSEAMLGKTIVNIQGTSIQEAIKNKVIGSKVKSVDTYGKNIILNFTRGLYLRNHMMMWGKWRIYDRNQFGSGKSQLPPRMTRKRQKQTLKIDNIRRVENGDDDNKIKSSNERVKNVQEDPRTRLILVRHSCCSSIQWPYASIF